MSNSSPKCPICNRFLRSKVIMDTQVKLCPNGDGSWLDPSVISTLSKEDVQGTPLDVETGLTLSSKPHHTRRKCPSCEGFMREYHWNFGSHIYLDTCRSCKGISTSCRRQRLTCVQSRHSGRMRRLGYSGSDLRSRRAGRFFPSGHIIWRCSWRRNRSAARRRLPCCQA